METGLLWLSFINWLKIKNILRVRRGYLVWLVSFIVVALINAIDMIICSLVSLVLLNIWFSIRFLLFIWGYINGCCNIVRRLLSVICCRLIMTRCANSWIILLSYVLPIHRCLRFKPFLSLSFDWGIKIVWNPLFTFLCHLRCTSLVSLTIDQFIILNEIACCLTIRWFLVFLHKKFFKCISIRNGVMYKHSIITQTSTVLVELNWTEVVTIFASESKLTLTIEYKIFIVKQLLLEHLYFSTHYHRLFLGFPKFSVEA